VKKIDVKSKKLGVKEKLVYIFGVEKCKNFGVKNGEKICEKYPLRSKKIDFGQNFFVFLFFRGNRGN